MDLIFGGGGYALFDCPEEPLCRLLEAEGEEAHHGKYFLMIFTTWWQVWCVTSREALIEALSDPWLKLSIYVCTYIHTYIPQVQVCVVHNSECVGYLDTKGDRALGRRGSGPRSLMSQLLAARNQ